MNCLSMSIRGTDADAVCVPMDPVPVYQLSIEVHQGFLIKDEILHHFREPPSGLFVEREHDVVRPSLILTQSAGSAFVYIITVTQVRHDEICVYTLYKQSS
ncbi:hypothetical protein DPMN_113386 [Dreissena polymorpha]|uniref:Uncharacterized protein n=1 Tax=Dreissena polymorpha TaxID=45954 RepID=A0A9D4KHV6_DREPO|nr:hypothetical protein DPMN_113386 [Dreissena polymorpha]